jgi:poly(A) polymerase
LFRNSRLIGRRFRLAHVRFGRDLIEVATFRATANDADQDRSHSDEGRILRDNVYGTIDEDIWRRDFTVNALYYNIADFSVWDYAGGVADIATRTLRLIDDPWVRYREDPVRMLRAARFAAKLGFSIEAGTAAPLRELGPLLSEVPAARLFEEVLKLFQTGAAVRSFDLLLEHGLLQHLFPVVADVLTQDAGNQARDFIRSGLASTDARVAAEQPITPMFLYAVLLWPAASRLANRLIEQEGASEYEALNEALARVSYQQIARTSLPKRFSAPMREMLMLQRRFGQRHGVRAARLLEHKRFRAAYDFLVLRSRAGEIEPELAEWWTEIQEQNAEEQQTAFGTKSGRGGRSRRGGRRGRRSQKDVVS